jgi:hypothetical protein
MSMINEALRRASKNPPPLPVAEGGTPAMRPVMTRHRFPVWPMIVFPLALLLLCGVVGLFFLGRLINQRGTAIHAQKDAVTARELADDPAAAMKTDPAPEHKPTAEAALPPPGAGVAQASPPSRGGSRTGAAPGEAATSNPVLRKTRSAPTNPAPQPNPLASQLDPVLRKTRSAPTNPAPQPNPLASQLGTANAEPAPAVAFPQVRLQGIFYRPANPAALINAKTVGIGDRIGNATVVAIDRSSVTLECGAQTNVLTLR